MSLELYIAYLATIAVFFASPPGPSQILMISNSMQHGLRKSVATAAGDLTANAIQMTAASFGLAAILATTQGALQFVKWVGVAYLVFVGVKTFLASPPKGVHPARRSGRKGPTHRRLFFQGFFTSSANPKAIFFFAALFPQFIDPNMSILPQLIILGVTYLVVDGVLLILYGTVAERMVQKVTFLASGLLNKISGALMIGAALILGFRDVSVSNSS